MKEETTTLMLRIPMSTMRKLRFAAAHLETSLNYSANVLLLEAMEARHIEIPNLVSPSSQESRDKDSLRD